LGRLAANLWGGSSTLSICGLIFARAVEEHTALVLPDAIVKRGMKSYFRTALNPARQEVRSIINATDYAI